MTTDIVYADLYLYPGERCDKRLSHPEPGTPGCPRWHHVALGAGWTENLLLGVAVAALSCSFLHQQSESPGSGKNGRVGDGNSTLENLVLELRQVLCPSQPHAAEGCSMCPQGWTLGRTKCYWVSPGYSPWSKSWEDCGDQRPHCCCRGIRMSCQEFLNETLPKHTRHFWIRLWVAAARMGWMWVNSSHLDRDWFQLDLGEQPGLCGMITGSTIIPDNCDLDLQGICQREATKL